MTIESVSTNETAGAELQSKYAEIGKTLDLSPEGIETTALRTLSYGLCLIRSVAGNDPDSAERLADAMHNLPRALELKDLEEIREYIIKATHAQMVATTRSRKG